MIWLMWVEAPRDAAGATQALGEERRNLPRAVACRRCPRACLFFTCLFHAGHLDAGRSLRRPGDRRAPWSSGLSGSGSSSTARSDFSTDVRDSYLFYSSASAGASAVSGARLLDSRRESLGLLSLASWTARRLLAGYRLAWPSMTLFCQRAGRIVRSLDRHAVVLLQTMLAGATSTRAFPEADPYGTCGSGIGRVASSQSSRGSSQSQGVLLLFHAGLAQAQRLELVTMHLTPHCVGADPVHQLRRLRRWVRPWALTCISSMWPRSSWISPRGGRGTPTRPPPLRVRTALRRVRRDRPSGLGSHATPGRGGVSALCTLGAARHVLHIAADSFPAQSRGSRRSSWPGGRRCLAALSDYAPVRRPRFPDSAARHPRLRCRPPRDGPQGDVWRASRQAHVVVLHLVATNLPLELRELGPSDEGAWRFHRLSALTRRLRRQGRS